MINYTKIVVMKKINDSFGFKKSTFWILTLFSSLGITRKNRTCIKTESEQFCIKVIRFSYIQPIPSEKMKNLSTPIVMFLIIFY